jgi:hypothetical protein
LAPAGRSSQFAPPSFECRMTRALPVVNTVTIFWEFNGLIADIGE